MKFKKKLLYSMVILISACSFKKDINFLKPVFQTNASVLTQIEFYEEKLYFGGDDGFIYVLNKDGSLYENIKVPASVSSNLFINDNKIYFSALNEKLFLNREDHGLCPGVKREKTNSPKAKPEAATDFTHGSLYYLDIKTKKTNEIFSDVWFLPAPLVYNGVIYFGTHTMKEEKGVLTEGNEKIYAFDMKKENVIWEKSGFFIASDIVIDNEIIYFGDYNWCLLALNTLTGEKIWVFNTSDKVVSKPLIYKEMVYFGSNDNNLYAVDKNTGKLKWKFTDGGAITASPVIYEDLVLFGGADGKFYALNKENGKEKWRFKANGIISSSCVVYKETVYFGDWNGVLYAVDINTGKEKNRFKAQGEIANPILLINNKIYFNDYKGNVYILSLT